MFLYSVCYTFLDEFVLFAVCVRGLGVEDGNITNSMLSASSSLGGKGPDKARLNGNSCWMPSASGLSP